VSKSFLGDSEVNQTDFIRAAILIARKNDHLPEHELELPEHELESQIAEKLHQHLEWLQIRGRPESVFTQPAKEAAERQRLVAKERDILKREKERDILKREKAYLESALAEIYYTAKDVLESEDLDRGNLKDKPTILAPEALKEIAIVLVGKKVTKMSKREEKIYNTLFQLGLIDLDEEDRVALAD
jgi:hypothetical protein